MTQVAAVPLLPSVAYTYHSADDDDDDDDARLLTAKAESVPT